MGFEKNPCRTYQSREQNRDPQVKLQVNLQVKCQEPDKGYESPNPRHMYTDLVPEIDQHDCQDRKQAAQNEGMVHMWNGNPPDQVKTKRIQDKADDQWNITFPPGVHLYVHDHPLVQKERNECQGNHVGTKKNDHEHPFFHIRRQVGKVSAGIEQHQHSK